MIELVSNDNSAAHAVIEDAMREGYQMAVDALREMAEHLNDENDMDLVRMLATTLEKIKP